MYRKRDSQVFQHDLNTAIIIVWPNTSLTWRTSHQLLALLTPVATDSSIICRPLLPTMRCLVNLMSSKSMILYLFYMDLVSKDCLHTTASIETGTE